MKDENENKKGVIPCLYRVCMMCKEIFGDAMYSNKGGFSHGVCPSEKCKKDLEDYVYKD